MRTCIECIPCFIRQALDAARMVTKDEKVIAKILRRVLRSVADFNMDLTPPEAGQIVHRIIREETGNPDPYFEIKEFSTKRALELSEYVKSLIDKSENSFSTAIRFSIAGNIMDFGMKSEWDEQHVMNSFNKAETVAINENKVKELYQKLSTARKILVLGDNAGEVVFDKLLIKQFPGDAEVIYAVKGSPVINDVTKYETLESGINEVAKIISNGADIQGTALGQCSDEFLQHFNSADVIISKGQGNFETLNTNSREIFFLLQVKCQVIADAYNYKLGDWLVTTLNDDKKNREVSHANCCSLG